MTAVKTEKMGYTSPTMRMRTAFFAILGVYLFHLLLTAFGVYNTHAEIDNLSHFLGGFVMGMLAVALDHRAAVRDGAKNLPFWFHLLFVVGFVMLVGVLWEFHEFILDHTLSLWYHLGANQPSLTDTMLDLWMDMIGSVAAFFVFRDKI